MARRSDFVNLFKKVIGLLLREKIEYAIIGGIAQDVWGRPRKTLDIDIVLMLGPDQYEDFLNIASRYKLAFVWDKALKQLHNMGMCRLRYGRYHVDFIMGYSDFEQEVFNRKRKVKIFEQEVWIASPEDVILYKLLSAREIDMADIHNIVKSQRTKLDKKYLRERAKIMQKDLSRMDIVENLKKILRRV